MTPFQDSFYQPLKPLPADAHGVWLLYGRATEANDWGFSSFYASLRIEAYLS